MNSKRVLLLVVMVLMIIIALGPHHVSAQAIRDVYTATEIPTGEIDHGDWIPIPNGGVHFRGQVISTIEAANHPQASGIGTLVANGNLDPTGTGPIWGTMTNVVPDSASCDGGGVWYGTWAGKMSMSQGYVYWYGVMQGVSGCVEGMMVRFESDMCVPQSPCDYSGTLLNPHGE